MWLWLFVSRYAILFRNRHYPEIASQEVEMECWYFWRQRLRVLQFNRSIAHGQGLNEPPVSRDTEGLSKWPNTRITRCNIDAEDWYAKSFLTLAY